MHRWRWRSAAVYATFVVALVFLPILTMSGVQGRIFEPLGLAYILAIMASLAVALTLTPALCLIMLPGADESAYGQEAERGPRHQLPDQDLPRRVRAAFDVSP
jgi:multidrug efflux pump subunit AcrB